MFDSLIEQLLGRQVEPASVPLAADEVDAVAKVASEFQGVTERDRLQKIFQEHNTTNPPNSDVAEQCQCADCEAYRKGK